VERSALDRLFLFWARGSLGESSQTLLELRGLHRGEPSAAGPKDRRRGRGRGRAGRS